MRMRLASVVLLLALLAASVLLVACGGGSTAGGTATDGAERPVIAVTTPILGAVVAGAVGDRARVEVVMPNGADPHEWRPSARDVATLQDADLIVQNGLGLEQGLTEAVQQARDAGVPVFTATDHVTVRNTGEADAGHAADDPHGEDADHGAGDPHFWTDPAQVRKVIAALPPAVRSATGADISASASAAAARLAGIDTTIAADFSRIPAKARNIVTGHESLGYLADRYDVGLTGAVTPSLSSQGQVSASHLKDLEDAMEKAGVRVVFTETGLPSGVTDAIAAQTGATIVELGTEAVPADGSYETYITELARRITSALSNSGG